MSKAPESRTGAQDPNDSCYFLGLELALDQVRAVLVDERLVTVGVEVLDFDSEYPEYATSGGITESKAAPLEMWLRGIDETLLRLSVRFDLSKIRSIGGCAHSSTVWWSRDALNYLKTLNPHRSLSQLFPHSFTVSHMPIPADKTLQSQSLTLESSILGPENHSIAHLSLVAAQIIGVRELTSSDVWSSTERITLASAFLSSLFVGNFTPCGVSDVISTGLWDYPAADWDKTMLILIGGGEDGYSRLRYMLGNAVTQISETVLGNVSRYFVERFKFSPDATVVPFTSDLMATYCSVAPSPSEAVVSFGPSDVLMTPAKRYRPKSLYHLYPHPAQGAEEKGRYVAVLPSRNGDRPRELVRDMYTKSWSAFDRLIAVIPPGGSIGLDDKLFSFWVLQGESFPFSLVNGVYRFETGVKVEEFRDLRANPRALLESQVLSFRVRYTRMLGLGAISRPKDTERTVNRPLASVLHPLGLSFDPLDRSLLPKKIIALGSAATLPSVLALLGDVFNAPVFIPYAETTQATLFSLPDFQPGPSAGTATSRRPPDAQHSLAMHSPSSRTPVFAASAGVGLSPVHRREGSGQSLPTGTMPCPSRASAALGAAYIAFWADHRGRHVQSVQDASASGDDHPPVPTFEQLIRQTLSESLERRLSASTLTLTPTISSATTEVAKPPLRGSRLGVSSPLAGDESDDSSIEDDFSAAAAFHASNDTLRYPLPPSVSTISSTSSTSTAGFRSTATVSTMGPVSPLQTLQSHSLATAASGLAAASVSASPSTFKLLPTADEDLSRGLVKASEGDSDAFMMYAALVPEYCRLEGMLVRSIV